MRTCPNANDDEIGADILCELGDLPSRTSGANVQTHRLPLKATKCRHLVLKIDAEVVRKSLRLLRRRGTFDNVDHVNLGAWDATRDSGSLVEGEAAGHAKVISDHQREGGTACECRIHRVRIRPFTDAGN